MSEALTEANNDEQAMLIADIERETRLCAGETGVASIDERILEAMRTIPRHRFISAEYRSLAYSNGPLPIGYGQTISQPFIVALMTQLLNLDTTHTVLEVGTGSGYQAAVLGRLGGTVYTTEIVPQLAERARQTLCEMAVENVVVVEGDGSRGLAEHAPYDRIIVTAAAPHIPVGLIAQLKPGGRMVIPVGLPYAPQQLQLVQRRTADTIEKRNVLAVAFVPLTGEDGIADSAHSGSEE